MPSEFSKKEILFLGCVGYYMTKFKKPIAKIRSKSTDEEIKKFCSELLTFSETEINLIVDNFIHYNT